MKRSWGVTLCIIFIFLTCFVELKTVLNIPWYWHVFQFKTQDQILLRFWLSLLGRILFIIAGIGLWQQKDWARKLAIVIFIINILSLPWKHPLMAIENSLTYYPTPRLDQLIRNAEAIASRKIDFVTLTAVFLTIKDVLVNAALIIYFTRKKVKQQFD